jgi:hypothetical protein
MKFIGDGSSGFAKVKVNYTKGGSPESETVTLYFNTEKPSDPQPTPDPDLYKPVLVPSVADNTTVQPVFDTELSWLSRTRAPPICPGYHLLNRAR